MLSIEEKEKYAAESISLVNMIANRYFGRLHAKIELDDLKGAGFCGLTTALNTFEKERGYLFSTYASVCIQNEIKHLLKKEFFVAKTECRSLNEFIGDDNGKTVEYLDLIPDAAPEVADSMILSEDIDVLLECVSELSATHRFVIEHRYGLNDKKVLRQEEIAELLNKSQAYICKLEKNIIRKLYFSMRAKTYQKAA